jgi:hypothetical protein
MSYFICLKASNQSDLMQHNVPAAIFHLAQYSVCSSRQRCRRGVRCAVRRVFLRVRVVAITTICITHGNTVCVRHVFCVLVKCFSGEKVWSAASVH